MSIGSTSKFTITDQSSNNCVMASSGHRLAFGNAGEYISGDGTDLDIISSGDLDITATLVDITGALTASGTITASGLLVNTPNSTLTLGTNITSTKFSDTVNNSFKQLNYLYNRFWFK